MGFNLNDMDFLIYIIGVFLTISSVFYLSKHDEEIKNLLENDKTILFLMTIFLPMTSWLGLLILLMAVDNNDNNRCNN